MNKTMILKQYPHIPPNAHVHVFLLYATIPSSTQTQNLARPFRKILR